jgi:hypothetical protein
MERAENAAADLLYVAEHWTTTDATLYDLKCRRRDLMGAARRYGKAMDALSRPIRSHPSAKEG